MKLSSSLTDFLKPRVEFPRYMQPRILKQGTELDKQLAWSSIRVTPPLNQDGTINGYPDEHREHRNAYLSYERNIGCTHYTNEPVFNDGLDFFRYLAI